MIKNLLRDKKGISNQIIIVLVMAVILIGIILVSFLAQLIFPPLQSVAQDTNTIFQETLQDTGDANLTAAGQASFQPVADSLNNLEWISYTLVILSFLVFIIMCFYVRTYPFLLIIWIILMIILIFVSLYLAVVYQDLRVDPTLGSYYTSWENTDFIFKNLPVILTIVMIIGGIVMFMLASKDREAEVYNQL